MVIALARRPAFGRNRGPAGQERGDDRVRFLRRSAGVPWAMIVAAVAGPPRAQLDHPVGGADVSISCSTITTVLPLPASAAIVVRSPSMLLGCSPTDGSSST